MLSWIKGIAAPLAVMALTCLMPFAAKADSVTYHTVVTFTSPGSGSVIGPANTLTGTGANSGDTLVANSIATATTSLFGNTAFPVSYGSFTMTGSTVATFVGATIQIDVFQDATVPPVGGNTGTSTFVGSATATFVAPALPSSLDSFVLAFTSGTSFTLPAGPGGFPPHVVYKIDDQQTISPNDPSGLGHSQISGSVTEQQAVPLPSTASIGLVLLAGLGAASMLRRRRVVVA